MGKKVIAMSIAVLSLVGHFVYMVQHDGSRSSSWRSHSGSSGGSYGGWSGGHK